MARKYDVPADLSIVQLGLTLEEDRLKWRGVRLDD